VKRSYLFASILFVCAASTAFAQIAWDKHRTGIPVPNPTSITGSQDEVTTKVKQLLERNAIEIAAEEKDEKRGTNIITTAPVVFARGIVARTQLGHFAELDTRNSKNIIQGRVTIKIEITPSTPSASLAGISTVFEGLSQQAFQTWAKVPSKGLLEDRILKQLVTETTGQSFDDIRPNEKILEPSDAEAPAPEPAPAP